MRASFLGISCALLLSCAANTDLTVPPLPKVHPSFKVEVPPALSTGRLPGWERPRGYQLSLRIDPAKDRFSGEAVIDVTLDKPTGALIMHAAQLDITRAEVQVAGRRIGAEVSYRKAAGARRETEELVLVTATELPAGDVKVRLEYSAPLEEKLRGIYRVQADKRWYVFTQFEPSDARRMFPCFDDPIYKVPFEVSVTVPKDNLVFSNAPEAARKAAGDELTFRFAPSQKMPTYLLALAIGPLEVLEGAKTPVPLRVITTPGKAKLGRMALNATAQMLPIMGDYFGTAYPYKKLDLVAVPNFGPGAMENAGLITFREELLLADESKTSAKAKRSVALVLAHELAHQWFGNYVTMAWWDDLWLNEGFATYMEMLVVDRWRPNMRADLEMLSLSGRVMGFDALQSARVVRQPVSNTYQAEEAFDGITYVKGASIVKMVHRWLGDEAFRDGVRNYIAGNAWGNATAADLFGALAKSSKQDVSAVAATFLDQPGVPLVSATVRCTAGQKPVVHLAQRRYRARPANDARTQDDPLWHIPVCLDVALSANGKPKRQCSILSQRESDIELTDPRCPAWVLPNAGYDGYYRFALPEPQLAKLGDATKRADKAAKVGYLTNLWSLVRAGEVPAKRMLATLNTMSREREREVIEQIIISLVSIDDSVVEQDVRPRYRRFVSRLLLPTAKRLGWDSRPTDSEDKRLLRRSVLAALAVLTDDPWMVRQARVRARKFMRDPSSVSSDTATIALRMAARQKESFVSFDKLVEALGKAKSAGQRVALVQALASQRDPADLRRAFDLVNSGGIVAQDMVYVLRAASDWPDSRRVLIEWLQTNLEQLAERIPGFGAARMVGVLRRLCDRGARRKAASAFTPMVTKMGSDRRLREALEHADLCIDLRSRQAKDVSSYLRQWR